MDGNAEIIELLQDIKALLNQLVQLELSQVDPVVNDRGILP